MSTFADILYTVYYCILLKLTTDRHETSRGLSATARLLVYNSDATQVT